MMDTALHFVPFLVTPVANMSHYHHEKIPIAPDGSTCGLYLAPSTIPGAGLGLFTGLPYQEGETVAPGDNMIPVLDLLWHNDDRTQNNVMFFWNDYTWDADLFEGLMEDADQVEVFTLGIGSIPNCHFGSLNVKLTESQWDPAGLHRSKDPGVGAFTPYFHRTGYARRHLVAGEELFVDYGYGYFEGHRLATIGLVPFQEDFVQADELLAAFLKVRDEVLNQDQFQFSREQADLFHRYLYQLVQDVAAQWPSRTWGALPSDVADIEAAAQSGTQAYGYAQNVRELDWLQEHGVCMDHIYAAKSTLPQAGRGAFAKRFLRQGEIVAPVPVAHVPNRSVLNIYANLGLDKRQGGYYRDKNSTIHQQLMLNYCFGHESSTLLLCQYGVLSSLINHNRTLANVRLAWSRQLTHRPEWLEQPIEEWGDIAHAGLAFEYIATRDIQPGEEIFTDYGADWEMAWNEHVSKWRPPLAASQYRDAIELNAEIDLVVPTVFERRARYPGVHTLCHEYYRTVIGLPASDYDSRFCKAIHRAELGGQFVYAVEIFDIEMDSDADLCIEQPREVLFGIPRDGFLFQSMRYNRDYAQIWSFRHELRIPDELMPATWVNEVGSRSG